jgi:hypothetical protein
LCRTPILIVHDLPLRPSPSSSTAFAATARLRRSAPRFREADFLHVRAADGAVDSLEAILRDFPVAVDLSARPEAFADLLADSPAAKRSVRCGS